MKQWICSFLIIASILCLCGCDTDTDNPSVNFYYVRNVYSYGAQDSVVVAEVYSAADYSDVKEILGVYLTGPQDVALASPFPDGTEVLEYTYNNTTAHITLSSHIAALSKVNQVLACACMARTVMELTGVETVNFQSDSSNFTRMEPITISKDSVVLYDNYTSTATTAPD